MRTLYLDLDGTILNIEPRLYSIYADVVKSLGGEAFSKEVYWTAKRDQLPEELIAKRGNVQNLSQYAKLRGEKLELPEYLDYDKLTPQAIESLLELKENSRIVLVTLRKSKENLYRQLQRLKIRALFDEILVGNAGEEGWRCKAKTISSNSHFVSQDSIIIGDSEADILAGKNLNMITVAVLSGIRSKNKLLLSQPDYIIEDISGLKTVLNNLPHRK